ncbi:helix-turn-helix domain-containing protein [Gluconobacter wancherniae]|uniref:hypothetical protein n=1 Tax=Gluconobacter wancherniae TaxID=1307955 RepID=UPI002011DC64|nr:hypothetical protein [Gluconobacter wancherniae]
MESLSLLDVYKTVGQPCVFAIGLADPAPDCLVEQAVNASMTSALEKAEALLIAQLVEVTFAAIAKDFD